MDRCCKCIEKRWLNPSPVVWNDSDGYGYCVFHSPEGYKRLQLGSDEIHTESSYNSLIYAIIDDVIDSSKRNNVLVECELSGAIFPWDISFAKYNGTGPLPAINLHGARFVGLADFQKVHFSGEADFMCTSFERDAKFGYAVFLGKALFESAHFLSIARFHGARFKSEANFSTAEFKDCVSFCGAKFIGKASFGSTNFFNEVCFISAFFGSSASFTYLIFPAEIDFRGTTVTHSQSIEFMGLRSEAVENLVFSCAEVDIFSFHGCIWPSILGFEKFMNDEYGYLECEQLYRAMKQRSSLEHDQLMVSQWHYREKLTQLFAHVSWERYWRLTFISECWQRYGKSSGLLKEFCGYAYNVARRSITSLLFWYWATSGFGERAIRAGVWLLALVVVSFVLNATPQPMDWNTLWGADAANATLATIPFAKDIPGDGWVKVGRGVWQFLIAVQFTLFALAVRNRFRR